MSGKVWAVIPMNQEAANYYYGEATLFKKKSDAEEYAKDLNRILPGQLWGVKAAQVG